MSFLGLDIGSSGCKAAVFNAAGRQLAFAFREYPTLHPHPGWAELDSESVVAACLAVIREAASQASGDPVAALSVSSQGEAFTPVTREGRILGNAMISSDARAHAMVEEWSTRFGSERLYRITGHTPHTLFSLFKLAWLQKHKPKIWRQAGQFLCFEDLIHQRLGLKPAIGWPLAGRTMLFDVTRHEWSTEILEELGLEPERLAHPLASGQLVGDLSRATTSDLGLATGSIVVAGGHDQVCAGLGAGAVEPGSAMYATGTVECITPAFDRAIFSKELFQGNLCTYDHAAPGLHATVAYSLTGGNLLRWFRDQWSPMEVLASRQNGTNAYQLILQELPDSPSPLLVLPYFTPSGTPHFEPHTMGAILGLSLTTTRQEVLRALLEGVALEMRLNLEMLENAGLPIRHLIAVGGGSQSRKWIQLKADVMGKPICQSRTADAGCLGAALLAAATATGNSPQTLARQWVKPGETIDPQTFFSDHYQRAYEHYRGLYPLIRDFTTAGRNTSAKLSAKYQPC